MSKFLMLDGDKPPRRKRCINLFDVCGLGAPRLLTPAEAAARQSQQSSAWTASEAGRQVIMEQSAAAAQEATEEARRKASEARKELWTPYDAGAKGKSIFAAYGLKGFDTMDAGRLAVCMMAAEGTLEGTPTRDDVEGLGEMAALALCGIQPEGMNDEQLAFWKRLRRAFTPPRIVRRAVAKVGKVVKKVASPKVTKFLKKGFRYIGATAFTGVSMFPGAGGFRNKVFGLKGKEAGFFDQVTQVAKMAVSVGFPPAGAVFTAADVGASAASGDWKGALMQVGTAAAGAGAGGALARFGGASRLFSKVGASSGIASKFSSFMGKSGKSFLGKSIAGKMGSALIKDKLKSAVYRMTKDKIGNFVMEKFGKKQIPSGDYENMPDGEPMPITVDSEVDAGLASHVAGSTTMDPQDNSTPGALLDGEQGGRGYPPDAVMGQTTAQVEARLDPADQGRFLTPAQEQDIMGAASKSEIGALLAERADQARYARPEPRPRPMVSPETMEGFMDDEEISLGQILAVGRAKAKARRRVGGPKVIKRRRFLI